jgi:uncharacterized membrane protein YfcA
VLTVAAGVVTGTLSGAFGVGGAVVSTPAIRVLGASAALAVGTTLPSIFPSAASGTARYTREGLIEWRAVVWTAPVGVAATVGGSLLSKVVPGHGHWLMVLTALLLGFTALRMGRGSDETRSERRSGGDHPGDAPDGGDNGRAAADGVPLRLLVGIGAVAGCLSGLLGIGGGVVMVPGFSELAGIPLKPAIATSLVCVGILAVPGTITHAVLGDIDWRFAVLLTVGVVPGARLGAVAAVHARVRHLRIAVAVLLGTLAVVYLGSELKAAVGG